MRDHGGRQSIEFEVGTEYSRAGIRLQMFSISIWETATGIIITIIILVGVIDVNVMPSARFRMAHVAAVSPSWCATLHGIGPSAMQ